MAELTWAPAALEDVDAAAVFIARTSEPAARLFARAVFALADDAAARPQLGAEVPEYGDPGLRERQHQSYRIIYRVTADRVEIARVMHGSRRLPRRPPG